jgi:hypothetical protein
MTDQMTRADFDMEIKCFDLMCGNWVARHGRSNRKLFRQFV